MLKTLIEGSAFCWFHEVSGHSGINGSSRAHQLDRAGSDCGLIDSELAI